MPESRYLSAFTPGQQHGGYNFYPPFINFTQIGDKVKIIVRSRDKLNEEKGYNEVGTWSEMEMPVKEFRWLLEEALGKLNETVGQ
jgi:hypothetical protein